jgi:hypothetical protein
METRQRMVWKIWEKHFKILSKPYVSKKLLVLIILSIVLKYRWNCLKYFTVVCLTNFRHRYFSNLFIGHSYKLSNKWHCRVSIIWLHYTNPAEAKNFSSNLCIQTGSGAYPASCAMGTRSPSSGVKRGRGVTLTTNPHLVPRSRMSRSYTSSSPCASVGVLWECFTFFTPWK